MLGPLLSILYSSDSRDSIVLGQRAFLGQVATACPGGCLHRLISESTKLGVVARAYAVELHRIKLWDDLLGRYLVSKLKKLLSGTHFDTREPKYGSWRNTKERHRTLAPVGAQTRPIHWER
jgi:hypothetical protein